MEGGWWKTQIIIFNLRSVELSRVRLSWKLINQEFDSLDVFHCQMLCIVLYIFCITVLVGGYSLPSSEVCGGWEEEAATSHHCQIDTTSQPHTTPTYQWNIKTVLQHKIVTKYQWVNCLKIFVTEENILRTVLPVNRPFYLSRTEKKLKDCCYLYNFLLKKYWVSQSKQVILAS